MSIQPGASLLHYRIVEKIGEGGMGVVWKGIDTTLDREVAIKLLPEAFAGEADRLARFEREARVLASLNHPNIAGIFGLHEQHGTRFLAMEMVPGETLADRIARGPLDPADALPIAVEIARALEAAHAAGIVHRDLKPANVRITPAGKVKVLDFGLAKAMAAASGGGSASASQSPTMTSAGSAAGLILGTAAYMSPEQARGSAADTRADVWAFGVVLFEMLSGTRPFAGATVTDLLAAVLKNDPDWNRLPAAIPPLVRRLLRRCLAKNVDDRLHHIADARLEIQEAMAERSPSENAGAAPARAGARGRLPWIVTAAALALAALAVAIGRPFSTRESLPTLSLAAPFPPGTELVNDQVGTLAISPTGEHLAVTLFQNGVRKIFLRSLHNQDWTALAGTDGAQGPFFSPDGSWLGFFTGGDMKKVPIGGGNPIPITRPVAAFRGASWTSGNVIVFAPRNNTPLMMVSANGGTATLLTRLDEAARERSHRWPQVLPDGDAVLFTVGFLDSSENYEESPIDAVRISTKQRKRVLGGASFARYVESGHLVFARGGSLFAVPFDPDSLETRGTPVVVMQNVMAARNSGVAHMDVSRNGLLAFISGAQASIRRHLTWLNADGTREAVVAPPDAYTDARISRDGRRVAVGVMGTVNIDVWLIDIGGARTKLTFKGNNISPVWSAKGDWVAFSSDSDGQRAVYRRRSDGGGDAELLLRIADRALRPTSWSADGRFLAVESGLPEADILILSIADRSIVETLRTDQRESMAQFSPDGRWIAYRSSTNSQDEVFVRAFPGLAGPWQVSVDGGSEPYWSADGSHLFFRSGDAIWVADVDARGTTFRAGTPTMVVDNYQQLISGDEGAVYSPDPNRPRFLILTPETQPDAAANRITVVVNWFDDLRRRR